MNNLRRRLEVRLGKLNELLEHKEDYDIIKQNQILGGVMELTLILKSIEFRIKEKEDRFEILNLVDREEQDVAI